MAQDQDLDHPAVGEDRLEEGIERGGSGIGEDQCRRSPWALEWQDGVCEVRATGCRGGRGGAI